jgi:hypothetical protein
MSNHNNIWLANWGKNAHLGIYKGLIFRECGLWGFVDKGGNFEEFADKEKAALFYSSILEELEAKSL